MESLKVSVSDLCKSTRLQHLYIVTTFLWCALGTSGSGSQQPQGLTVHSVFAQYFINLGKHCEKGPILCGSTVVFESMVECICTSLRRRNQFGEYRILNITSVINGWLFFILFLLPQQLNQSLIQSLCLHGIECPIFHRNIK